MYDAVFNDRPTLWTKVIGGAHYSISLSFDPDGHAEGDLSLLFEKDDIPIYEMSFAIVPGQLIGSTSSRCYWWPACKESEIKLKLSSGNSSLPPHCSAAIF